MPPGHVEQIAEPAPSAKRPVSHGKHSREAEVENIPATHSMQLAAASAAEAWPEGQLEHAAEPAVEANVPGAHAEQEDE